MELVADEIIRFARAQIDAGADIIAISDPSGTGEILGPKLFENMRCTTLTVSLTISRQKRWV